MFVNGRAMQFYIAHVPQHTFECKILLYHIDIHKSFKYSRCEEFDRHCTLSSLKVCMWKLMLWSGQYFYFFKIMDLWIKDKVKNFGGKHFFFIIFIILKSNAYNNLQTTTSASPTCRIVALRYKKSVYGMATRAFHLQFAPFTPGYWAFNFKIFVMTSMLHT